MKITLHLSEIETAALAAEAKDAGASDLESFTAGVVAALLQQRRARMVAETLWTTSRNALILIDEYARQIGGSQGQMKIARIKAVRALSVDFDLPGDIKAAKAYVEANWTQNGNGRRREGGE